MERPDLKEQLRKEKCPVLQVRKTRRETSRVSFGADVPTLGEGWREVGSL